MNPRNLFAELKWRNVLQVAGAFTVVACLVLPAGSILFPALEAPPWVKVVIALLILGFPVATARIFCLPTAPLVPNECRYRNSEHERDPGAVDRAGYRRASTVRGEPRFPKTHHALRRGVPE